MLFLQSWGFIGTRYENSLPASLKGRHFTISLAHEENDNRFSSWSFSHFSAPRNLWPMAKK